MKKIFLLTIAAGAVLLAGCEKQPAPADAIAIEASVGPMTKVAYEGDETRFTTGDRIALYGWTGSASAVPARREVDGIVYAFDGTSWSPATQTVWPSRTDSFYFLGVSPALAAGTDPTAVPYTLDPADQAAGDLLVATNLGGVKATDGPVALTFDHTMAKLNVNLKFRSQWTTTPTVSSVKLVAKTAATVNCFTKAVSATGRNAEVEIPATNTAGGYALSYSGLQVPQEGVRKVIVTIDGKDYVYEATTDIPLVSGQYTTIGLVLDWNRIELESISVSDWEGGGELPDGNVQRYMYSTPLTLEAAAAGAQVTFTIHTTAAPNPVYYSTDGGINWNPYTSGTPITLTNVGDKVQFKGDNERYASSYDDFSNVSCSADCYVYGNIMSLISASDFSSNTTLTGVPTFENLFRNNEHLMSHDTKRLVLPATTLVASCYDSMFSGCINLKTAPELPAGNLANFCYNGMFSGCTSLTTAPKLPAGNLANFCYNGMFSGCTSLTTAPKLPAENLADYCYDSMFSECTSLTTAPKLPAENLADYCYFSMFSGCTSLTTAPELPAENLANNCYNRMFTGCTSLTTAPELPAENLANNCYNRMFTECTSLTTAPELPATTLTEYCYCYMFYECTSLTTAPKLPAENLANFCYSSMFSGCTSLTTAPELPAENLANNCYYYMFSGCTSLTTAPKLPAENLADFCYNGMFSGCTSLTTAPKLPAENLADSCYNGMFSGCTRLKTAPELPAGNLANFCYNGMFSGCTSLTTAPKLPATTLAEYCYGYMFSGCTSLTTAPKLPATTLAEYCYRYMFSGCTSLTTAPKLPAENLADSCYDSMFSECTSLTTAPKLPAENLADYCYFSMFSGCTSLTTAPELPATTLAEYCYGYMFSGCTSLNSVTCLATDISASNCTYNWLYDVSSTGTITTPSTTGWTTNSSSGIPTNWTRVNSD